MVLVINKGQTMNGDFNYLVLSRREDEPHLEVMSKDELEKQLNDGEFYKFQFLEPHQVTGDINEFPARSVLIFKGAAVKPEPVHKVVEYKLP